MAFNLVCMLENYEFRGYDGGILDDGTEWHKMILESASDSKQLRVTVPKDLWPDVKGKGFNKGDVVVLRAEVASGMYQGKHFDRVRLLDVPQIIDEEGEIR